MLDLGRGEVRGAAAEAIVRHDDEEGPDEDGEDGEGGDDVVVPAEVAVHLAHGEAQDGGEDGDGEEGGRDGGHGGPAGGVGAVHASGTRNGMSLEGMSVRM